MKLSEHFTLAEFTRSDYAIRHGIDNTPSAIVTLNLIALCRNTLEPLRTIVKRPIQILSGYRSEEVNKGIGGAPNSQHITGQAADIVVPDMTIEELHDLATKFVPHDQAIQEFDEWLHISYNAQKNRQQKLWAVKMNGKTTYLETAPAKVPGSSVA